MLESLKVTNLEVEGKTFTAKVKVGSKTLNIKGLFTLYWHGTIPDVIINLNCISGMSAPNLLDIDYLCEQIGKTDDGTWYHEYMNSLSNTLVLKSKHINKGLH